MKIHKYIYQMTCGCKRVNEQVSKNPAPRVGFIRWCPTHGNQNITNVKYVGKVESGT